MDDNNDVSTISYDRGINDDPYSSWRNNDSVGYVHLAYRIIVEALYDLICGTHDQMLSASIFFYGTMYTIEEVLGEERESYTEEKSDPTDTMAGVDWSTGSMYPVWATVLGLDKNKLPRLAEMHRKGIIIPQKEVDDLRKLYTIMVTGKMERLK